MTKSNQPHKKIETEILESQSTPSLTSVQHKPISSWRLLVPLALQLALIVSVPAQAVYTYVTGKTIVLQTAPVDPYDFLRGYYQILNYDISTPDTLKSLPGWIELSKNRDYLPSGTMVYVILEQPTQPNQSQPPQVWKPVRVSAERPQNLSDNQIAIKGESNGWRIEYGLETYYMPENQREQVNSDINEAQFTNPESFVVEVKVNSNGKAIPVSLWVRDRNYTF